MEGKAINGRSVKVGDTIMNEWNLRKMIVIRKWEERRRFSSGPAIRTICLRGKYLDNGTEDTISGRYWKSTTRLIERAK